MSIYISEEEDVLDLICFRTYGYAPGAMEAVLERNPFLADSLDSCRRDWKLFCLTCRIRLKKTL